MVECVLLSSSLSFRKYQCFQIDITGQSSNDELSENIIRPKNTIEFVHTGNWFSSDFFEETRGVETTGVVTCATLPMYGAFTNTSPP